MNHSRGILVIVGLFFGSSMFAGQYRPLPSVPVIPLTIDSILNGALDSQGTDFAWKANQIYRYNYSKAMKRGSANLNLALAKDIADISANPSYDQAAKIRLLQSSINSLYRILEEYRNLDAQAMTPISLPLTTMPVSPAPTIMMRLSLESILNGALGEPYTARANEVYRSGTVYADALAKDINRDVNANYTNESTRTNAFKSSIDKNYNFLTNYRKSSQPVMQAPVYVPAPPVPTQMLSLQSILSGTLGEPYTSRVNTVYNSGVAFYVDDMVRGINSALNANYSDQTQRINAIKSSIDRNYNFLMSYRKNNPY